MIRRRAFTSRVVAAAIAGPGCVPRRGTAVAPRANTLWRDPSPKTPGGMLPDVALERGARAFEAERARKNHPAPARLMKSWSTTVSAPPTKLLAGARGVVACGDGNCFFVDPRGKAAGGTDRWLGGLTLDADGARLLSVGRDDHEPVVHDVRSGKRLGSLRWSEGEAPRQFARWDGLYLLTSVQVPEHRSEESPTAGARLAFMPTLRPRARRSPVGTRPVGFLQSIDSSSVIAAASPQGLTLATPRGVQWTDWALRPGADWRRTIDPLGLAMDDDGNAVLVAKIDRAPRLLVLDPLGGVKADVALSQATEYPDPPLLGRDGVIVLAPKGELIAYDQSGNVVWHFAREGTSAPLALGDAGILVEHAGQLWHTDWAGHAHPIANLPGPLTAGPAVHQGAWYVATADAVHRFDPPR
ncbi:MAG: hypothetical protein AAF721_08490 [Myxococcota bacterium]